MTREHARISIESFSEVPMTEVEGSGYHKGCWVTPVKGFIFVLLAIFVALVVGLIVFAAKPCKECSDGSSSEGIPTTIAPPLEIDYRLPTDLVPSQYELYLRPDIYNTDNPDTFAFTGSVTITLECKKRTNRIILHSRNLKITKVALVESTTVVTDGASIGTEDHSWDEIREFLTIPLAGHLEEGKEYRLSLSFEGPITADLRGIYWSSYELNNQTRYVLSSQLQPTDARKVFPCLDEPNFKATFNVIIARQQGFTSMSNGVIDRNETLSDGWVEDHYTPSLPMSTYLLAFMVTDFRCDDSYTTSGKLVQICARPNAFDQLGLANSVSAPIQSFFEDYHNLSYPLDKTIHAGVPDFAAGAMENWGLIIYRDYNILYNPVSSTSAQKQRIVVVIAHELAHQWFGNLVSMEWWSDVWLNEGFASYMETLGTNHMYPDWEMEDDLILDKVQYVLAQDSLVTSHPVFQAADNPAQISALFDSITYDKGASIIRMMRYFLGNETFVWGLSKYLKDRAYDTAKHDDLFNFLTQEADGEVDVNAVMKTWILQLGYPVVTFNFDKNTRKVTVSQKHFLLDPKSAEGLPESPYNYEWKIPISLATDIDNDLDNEALYRSHWLNTESVTLPDPVAEGTKWILGNLKQRFYYRVNYDQDNWDALINTLHTSHQEIDHKNRAQLIDDSFNLGRAGEINQTMFLDISRYLKVETEHIPWWSATRGFNYMDKILRMTGDYGIFKTFVWSLMDPQYTRVGWNETEESSHVDKLKRAIILQNACYYDLQDCVEEGKKQFDAWIADSSTNDIVPNLRYTVYCTGLSRGGQTEWDIAFARMKQADSGAEEKTLMQALSCTKQPWLLQRYLEMAFAEKEIRRQDFMTVFTNVADTALGSTLAWEFMVNNWQDIYERLGQSISFHRVVKAPCAGFSTEFQYNMLQSFISSQQDLGASELSFKQALETVRSNIEWREANQDAIRAWLLSHNP